MGNSRDARTRSIHPVVELCGGLPVFVLGLVQIVRESHDSFAFAAGFQIAAAAMAVIANLFLIFPEVR